MWVIEDAQLNAIVELTPPFELFLMNARDPFPRQAIIRGAITRGVDGARAD